MALSPEQQAAVDRLGSYNGRRFASDNLSGFAGDGYKTQFPAACNDAAIATAAVSDLAEQAQQAVTDAETVVAGGAAALQAIADGVIGSLAATVPASTQGAALVAATTPDAASSILAGRIWCGTSGGASNALTLAPSPALTSIPTGTVLEFVAGTSNAAVTRSNLLTYSEQFDNAAWTKAAATIAANASAAPTGSVTMDKLVESATTADHRVTTYGTANRAASICASIYVKAAERSSIAVQITNDVESVGVGAVVNLGTGVAVTRNIGSPSSYAPAKVESVGGGIYRISVSGVLNSAGSVGTVAMTAFAASSSGTTPYAGDGTSGLYLWGAQFEAGATPSPYIPTTTAPVTVVDGHSTLYTPALGARWLLDANGAALAVGAVVAGRKYHATWDGVSWRLATNTDIPAGLTYRLDQLARNAVLAMASNGRL